MPIILRCPVCDRPTGTMETPCVYREDGVPFISQAADGNITAYTLVLCNKCGALFPCKDHAEQVSKEHEEHNRVYEWRIVGEFKRPKDWKSGGTFK